MTQPEKFKLKDIGWGLVIPIIVGLLIILFPAVVRGTLMSWFGMESPIPHILTFGFAQMVIFGVPIILGLIWNKWAGGAAGFILGTAYYLAMAGYSSFNYLAWGQTWNFFADPSLLMYIVNGALIGYIAGSLNNGSSNFKRMLGAGLTAAIATGVLQFLVNATWAIKPNYDMTWGVPPDINIALTAFAIYVMVPQIVVGFLMPVVAKVMTWYGLQPTKH